MDTRDKISGISTQFKINEATIKEIQSAFQSNRLTSKQLVQYYLDAIKQDKLLHAVIEVNPDALSQAEKADNDRNPPGSCCSSRTIYASPMSMLQGIPVLLKDNISTNDKLQTTCGSFALCGSVVPRDAVVVSKLRLAGAIILGKANLSQWANFRSPGIPPGWSSRGGTVQNPYSLGSDPGGSSTGSAVSVAANLVTVSLGTETSGSIMNPCNYNCVVGIKPTVGLTSRSGVIPLTSRQDSVGPIGRTVSDAVYVLDVIVGSDPRDEASKESAKYIPPNGYTQFLKEDGLNGKRIGNMWNGFKIIYEPDPSDPEEPESSIPDEYQRHMDTLRKKGAVLINYENPNFEKIVTEILENIPLAFYHEFKRDLNIYLSNLLESPIRSLADAIAFNNANPEREKLEEYGQEWFIKSEATNLPSSEYTEAISKLENLSKEVFDTFMIDNNLDAVVVPEAYFVEVLGIRGCPSINVPAGFDSKLPFGILFGGFKGSEGKLIEIAYAFEQATKSQDTWHRMLSVQAFGDYHRKGTHHRLKEKVTHLHFYLHDILSGDNPTAVLVAHANKTYDKPSKATPFGGIYAIDDPLTVGPEPNSTVIGSAQGIYVSTGLDKLTLLMSVDFGFTTGKFNGSSLSVLSRNPVGDGSTDRELAVVGGRGKFRLARGFAELKTSSLNTTNGDAVIEYNVTVFHY